MKCEICNKAIKGDCQFINGAYYHNMCLEQVIVVYKIEQKVLTHTEKQLDMQLDKWERLKEWLKIKLEDMDNGIYVTNAIFMRNEDLLLIKNTFQKTLDKMYELEEE